MKSTHQKDKKNSKIINHSNLKPQRWIVERTFAWMGHYRRLTKDYERNPTYSESMIRLSMIQLMLNRLTRDKSDYKRWV